MSFKKSHDDFLREIKSKFGEMYKFNSKYLGVNKKIEVEHIPCGYIWNPLATNLLQGKSNCPNCSGKTFTHTIDANNTKVNKIIL